VTLIGQFLNLTLGRIAFASDFFGIVYCWFLSYISSIISILLFVKQVRPTMIDKNNKIQYMGNLSAWMEGTIRDFYLGSADNSMNTGMDERAVDEPLVGFSSGVDPLYDELKDDIGYPFMTPIAINRSPVLTSGRMNLQLSALFYLRPGLQRRITEKRRLIPRRGG